MPTDFLGRNGRIQPYGMSICSAGVSLKIALVGTRC